MASLIRLSDFTKEGDGLPEKKRTGFLLFIRIAKNNFWKLMTLNIMFIAFSVPVVTIPAAYCAMMRILRDMTDQKLIFLWQDYWAAFKENFVQSLFLGIIFSAFCTLSFFGIRYLLYNSKSATFIFAGAILMFLSLIFFLTNLYIPIMIVSVKQRLIVMYNNAFRLAFIALFRNFLTLIITLGLTIAILYMFPYSLVVIILLFFSMTGLIICFNIWPIIKKYVIH